LVEDDFRFGLVLVHAYTVRKLVTPLAFIV